MVALGTPAFDDLFDVRDASKACELVRIGNDGIADLATRNPKRFIGAATLPLLGPDALEESFKELERTLAIPGMRAVQLYTRVNNVGMDDARFNPLWEIIAARDIAVLLHPTGGTDNPLARDYLLWLTFGWPLDTSLVMLRLAYTGLFQRFPRLRILTHHLGAFIPLMAARIQGVHYTVERTGGIRLQEPILDSLRRFYGDTTVNGYPPALDAGFRFFGSEHILFGTDYPYVPIAPQCSALRNWDLSPEERAKIADGNARRMFGLNA